MEWAERMNRALDYLEEHLEGDTDYRAGRSPEQNLSAAPCISRGKGI